MLRSSRTRSFTVLCRRSITSASQYNHGAISGGQTHTNLHRKPVRGGQNLSGRWTRLENSLRQKAALSKELEGFAEHDASLPKDLQPKFVSKAKSAPLFHGFIVPEEPNPPADNECCMSGCAVCVYDLHGESLEAYNEAVAALRTSLSALGIPPAEWPAHIRPKENSASTDKLTESRKGVIMDAFEEMERKLALKRARATNSAETLHWRKRQELVAIKKAEARDTLWNELSETIRWVLFSGR